MPNLNRSLPPLGRMMLGSLLIALASRCGSASASSLWTGPTPGEAISAEESATTNAASSTDRTDGSPFARGQWSLEFTTSYTDPFHGGPQELFTGNVAIGYSPKDGLQTTLELAGIGVNDESGDDGVAAGLTLRTRLEVLKVKSASIFIDGSIGVIEADVGIPDGGTHFNFRETAGAGVMVPLNPRLYLLGGVHLLHISNAGLGHDNPGYSGTEFYVGVTIPL